MLYNSRNISPKLIPFFHFLLTIDKKLIKKVRKHS
ncbi:MAG: hypothetical protein JWQ54_5247 [Mucilaginibacter sp.]|nr:hypothetical protein [Mucilaginibacter sp.]